MRCLSSLLFAAALLAGCGDDTHSPTDAGPMDAGTVDLGVDAGPASAPAPAELCDPGSLGAFRSLGVLGFGRESHTVAHLPGTDRLLSLGGWSGLEAVDAVEGAAVDDLERWGAEAARLPSVRQHHGLVVSHAALCVIGGDDGRDVGAEVDCLALDAEGGLATEWTPGPRLPAPRSGHETVLLGSDIYVLGGVPSVGGDDVATVFRARLGADGVPGAWDEARPLPAPLSFGAAAVLASPAGGGRLYYAGGVTGDDASISVLTTEVDAAGRLGPWTEAARLPGIRIGSTAHVASGVLWLVGGFDGAGIDEVGGWPIAGDGSLGAWVPGPSLLVGRWGHASVLQGGRLFVIGGWESLDRAPRRSVLVAACP